MKITSIIIMHNPTHTPPYAGFVEYRHRGFNHWLDDRLRKHVVDDTLEGCRKQVKDLVARLEQDEWSTVEEY